MQEKKETIVFKKNFIFDSDVTRKSISNLIQDIDELNPFNYSPDCLEITIYFSTHGGILSTVYILGDYIKRLCDHGVVINIVVTEFCYSAGMYLLAKLHKDAQHCKRCVNVLFFKHSKGLLHEVGLSLHTRDDRPFTKDILDKIELRKQETLKFFKKYMTKEEITRFNSGGDVYFDCDIMAKMFNGTIIEVI